MLLQVGNVRLDPFRRAEETLLLAVPGGVDDRAARTPAGFRELSDGARFLQLRKHAADRIARAVYPRVVVIPVHHPLVGAIGAGEFRDDTAPWHELPVELELHVHARRAGPEVIG